MTIDELKKLKHELDEVVALRENVTACQERCNQLLEETRSQRRSIAELELMVNVQLRTIARQEEELNELRGAVVLTAHG